MEGIILYGFFKINFKNRGTEILELLKHIENFYDDLNYDPDFFLKEKYYL
jgi:hypothetical protein